MYVTNVSRLASLLEAGSHGAGKLVWASPFRPEAALFVRDLAVRFSPSLKACVQYLAEQLSDYGQQLIGL